MRRFFIIDDNGQDIEKLKMLLHEHGFSATELEKTGDDRNPAHEELRRANDTLRAIIESAPTAIIGLDLDGNVRDVWNPAAETMLGWSAREVMGRPLPSVPEESEEEFRQFREWIRSGRNMNGVEVKRRKRDGSPIEYSIYASPLYDVEGRITGNIAVLVDIAELIARREQGFRETHDFRFLRRDGLMIDTLVSASPLVDERGDFIGAFAMVTDISDRKRTEEALIVSERKYRAVIEHAPFGISRSTRGGELLSVNPAFARILKYDSPEEMLEAVNRSNVQDVLFSDPSRRGPIVERIFEGDSWHVFENRYRCKDGTVITCMVHSRKVLGQEGKESEFESFIENITERLEAENALRESEEKFRVLAETSPTAIFLYQGEMIIYANPATERLFGYGADELLRMRFWDWAHDDFKEMVRDSGLARLKGDSVPARYESRFVTKSGEDRWLMVSAGLIDYRGMSAGIASFLDITATKRVEEQLQASLAEKEILLREVHHRVKNNLQVISALLDLQSDYIRDEQSLDFFQESRDRIKTMALVHERLYNSKDFTSIDFGEYVENLIGHLTLSYLEDPDRVSVKLEMAHVSLGIQEAIPCGLIINELITNSMKHAFPAGRKGEVIVVCREDDDGSVRLEVRDNGVGLPAGLDFRNTETLGLQLVTMLTKQLRGRVEVDGEQAGASFIITFPGGGHDPAIGM